MGVRERVYKGGVVWDKKSKNLMEVCTCSERSTSILGTTGSKGSRSKYDCDSPVCIEGEDRLCTCMELQ